MPHAVPDERPAATYADIEALPEHLVGEIIEGGLLVSPRPAPRHIQAASGLVALLGGPFQLGVGGPGGWWVLQEPELHLGKDIIVPDLAAWRLERMQELPDTAWFELRPDWICEVLSPSTERTDRVRKLAIYARERVAHVWLLNPVNRTLEALRLAGDTWTLVVVHGDGEQPARIEPFEAVDLRLSALWSPPVVGG